MSSLLVPASWFVPSIHALPRPLLTAILLLVPVNTRLRCTEVSRAWRALLADTAFWERLNFSQVTEAHFSEALFVAAFAKAGGRLRELDVCGRFEQLRLTHAALVGAVAANSNKMQRLRVCSSVDVAVPRNTVAELSAAAPGLQKLEVNVTCIHTEARALLRREPPFGALNIRGLIVVFPLLDGDEHTFLSCVADLKVHGACLKELYLDFAPMPSHAGWDALADAAISLQLTQLTVSNSPLGPWCVPGLARLLREGSISSLRLDGTFANGPFVETEIEPVLSSALRANSTLSYLALSCVDVWNPPGKNIVSSLVGHPLLHTITLNHKVGDDAQLRLLAGTSLGRLVAANSRALRTLDVSDCALGDDGLRPLFAALPSNTNLWRLFADRIGVSAAFAPDILASVRANQSLFSLHIDGRKQNNNDPGDENMSSVELREAEGVAHPGR